VLAVGEHLGHSERMLIELSNEAPDNAKQKEVDISAEQRRAEDLLQENRLYRQTALQEGDAGLASVLDELERVLLDVAHSPEQVTPAQLQVIQKKIEARGICSRFVWSTGTAATAGGHKACAGAKQFCEKREEQSMTIGNSSGKTGMAWLAIAALLFAPAVTRARMLKAIPIQSGDFLQDPQETQDKEQEKRDREQEARDREEEKTRPGTGSSRTGPGKDRTAPGII